MTLKLERICEQVMTGLTLGHTMKAKEDAFEYLEKLIIQLLGMICSRPSPHSVQEVQDRIQKLFPPPIDEWAIDAASSAIKLGKRKLVFPVEKIHPLLKVNYILTVGWHSKGNFVWGDKRQLDFTL